MKGRAQAVLLLALLCFLPIVAKADIASGIAWLAAQQRADGALVGPLEQVVPFQATAEAIDTLAELDELDRIDAAAALAYLDADPYLDTEWLARRVIAKARLGHPVTDLIDRLRTHRNRDGGFGSEPGHQSTLLSTAWALRAFAAAGQRSDPAMAQAVGWLLNKQQASGRWPAGEDDTGLYPTTQVTTSLWSYRHTYALGDRLERASDWLLSERQANGGWEDIQGVAWILLAVSRDQSRQALISDDVIALQSSHQMDDGSWRDEAYLTAVILSILRAVSETEPNPGNGSIGGRVVSAKTGQVVADAQVDLVGTTFSTTSGLDGRFEFSSVPAGSYELLVTSDASYPASGMFNVVAGQYLDVGDVSIVMGHSSPMISVVGNARFESPQGVVSPAEGVRVSVAQYSTVSDAEGRYALIQRFRSPASGQITIRAEYPGSGYPPIEAMADVEAGDTVIFNPLFKPLGSAPGASLMVSVHDADTLTPISGASVSLAGATVLNAATNGDGEILLEKLNAGKTEVTVTVAEYDAVYAEIDVVAGGRYELPVLLGRAPAQVGRIYGKITDELGHAPIAGASILLNGEVAQVTGVDGVFDYGSLAPGRHEVDILAVGYANLSFQFSIEPGQALDFGDIRLVSALDPGTVTLSGAARFRSGDALLPAAGARIEVEGQIAVADGSGAFRLEGLPHGELDAVGYFAGYPLVANSLRADSGSHVLFSPIFEHRGAAEDADIRVRVIDARSKAPLVGARVRLSGANSGSGYADDDGVVVFSNLIKGPTYVTSTMSGYGGVQSAINVVSGRDEALTAVLPKIERSNPFESLFAMPVNYHGRITGGLFVYGEPGTEGFVHSAAGLDESFVIGEDGVSLVQLPIDAQLRSSGRVEGLAIRVNATGPVSLNWLSRVNDSSDATTVFDIGALGTEYYGMSYAAKSGGVSQLTVAAPYDGTVLTITPSVGFNTPLEQRPAGVPFTMDLQAGQAVMFNQGNRLDLSGTHILANKPIALFGSNLCVVVPDGAAGACDFLVSQLPSVDHYSTRVIIGETAHTGEAGNLVRILSANDGNEVTLNGQPLANLNAGEFYQIDAMRGGGVIEASAPVLVVKYLKSQSTIRPYDGDPSMSYVPGPEHWLDRYIISTPVGDDAFQANFLHVVIDVTDIGSLLLDGYPVDAGLFEPINSQYSYANIPVEEGLHTIEADHVFLAMLSGFDDFDSYLTLAATGFSPGASHALPIEGEISVKVDASEYGLGADVVFGLAAVNRGARSSVLSASLRVSDAHGRPVVEFDNHAFGRVGSGQVVNAQRVWSTDALASGLYVARSELLDPQGNVIAADSITFEILAGDGTSPAESLALTTDKPQYTLGEPVTWSARVDNLAGNRILRRAQVALTVTDALSGVVAEHLIDLPEIQPNGQYTAEAVLAALTDPGTYTLQVDLLIDGEAVTDDTTTIELIAASVLQSVLSGAVTLETAQAPVGEGVGRLDVLANLGEAPLTDLRIARVLADDVTGEEIARTEATVSLPAGGRSEWTDTLATDGLSEGEYLALLLVREGEQWLVIAHSALTLTAAEDPGPQEPDPQEPDPVAIPVLDGRALLVLAIALLLLAAAVHRGTSGTRHTGPRPTRY